MTNNAAMTGQARTTSRRVPRATCALLAASALTIGAPAGAQQAPPVRIHVRGSAQVEGNAWSEPDGFVVRGVLIDDAGEPIAAAPLSIQIVSGESARRDLPPAGSCGPPSRGTPQAYRASPEGYALETDERGGFCLRGRGALEKGAALRVQFAGTKLHEGTQSRIEVDALQAGFSSVVLRFDPAVDAIDLDRESLAVTAALRIDRSAASRSAAAGALQREGLTVVLEDERGTKLGEATTGGDGRARFEVKASSLDGPGQGELRARFDGNATLAKASASQPVVRRAQVALALSHPLDPASAEDGIPIDVEVTSARGAVDGGVVEALRAGESVGAGAVQQGKARVIAAFASEREGRVPITLRYVPAAPWWRPGPDLAIQVPVAGPGVWRQVALGALVLAIAGWVLGGWRRAPKPAAAADQEAKAAPPSGRAGVRIMGPSEGAQGWRGTVTDAHDGTPIDGAELTVVVPVFEGTGVIVRVATDQAGAFTIDAAYRSDARLVVHATTHSTYEQALPAPSTLGVALVTRRRAILDRLVRWSRRQGPPFEGPPEPTPGHVRRVASRAQDRDIERWASGIESAAFGPDVVDERVEQELRTGEPRAGARGTSA